MSVLKKALSVCLAAMLVSAPCMMVSAEETADAVATTGEVKSDAAVKLTVGEPDDNGIFTAKLSIHNANFLGMQFGFNYNKDVVVAVDENGEPTDQLRKATTFYPFEKDGLCAEFIVVNSKLSNENGLLQVASITLESKGKELVADDAGFLAYEFRFKKIAEGDAEFALADYPYANYEKEALLSGAKGGVPFRFEFVYEGAENTDGGYDFGADRGVADEVVSPEETIEASQKARLKDTVMLQIDSYVVSVEGVIKWVDKDNKNVVPYIENDRTMVPLRFISESFGADVKWIPESATIEIALGDTKIVMNPGKMEYQLNGEVKTMDTAPVIREDRTMVPLRFVSEALGKAVYWDAPTRTVIVSPADFPWDHKDPVAQDIFARTLLTMKWLGDEAYANEE